MTTPTTMCPCGHPVALHASHGCYSTPASGPRCDCRHNPETDDLLRRMNGVLDSIKAVYYSLGDEFSALGVQIRQFETELAVADALNQRARVQSPYTESDTDTPVPQPCGASNKDEPCTKPHGHGGFHIFQAVDTP